jgi:hypothetical protein
LVAAKHAVGMDELPENQVSSTPTWGWKLECQRLKRSLSKPRCLRCSHHAMPDYSPGNNSVYHTVSKDRTNDIKVIAKDGLLKLIVELPYYI